MSTPPATAQQGALQASALAASTRPGQTVDVKVPLAERLRANPRLPLMLAAAAAVAALIVLVMWSRQPDYKVLFSNLSDRDGGAIITSMQQMNV
ncbi:MAG: flagellar basal-body MS-ring/collar protein FliF, partial [Janthinobacterium lividum]